MATQDESGGFDFGRLALRALAGAAAGSQADSLGGGFLAGVKTAQQFQDRDAAQLKAAQQAKRQATADTRAQAEFNQRSRARDQAFRINEQKSEAQQYADIEKRNNMIMGNRANGYNRNTVNNMVKGNFGPSNDFVENPDEPAATSITSWAQSGNVMAAGDYVIKSMDIHENSADPRMKKRAMQNVMAGINKAGGQYHPAVGDDSPAFFTLKGTGKAFPVTTKGAREFHQALKERTTAFVKQVQNAYMTAENAQSGALISITKNIDNAVKESIKDGGSHQLDDTEIGLVANQFTQWIKKDPQLTKAYTLANLVKRQQETKAGGAEDGKDRSAELATGLATMKRYGVKIESLANGKPTIDNDSFNAWMNRNEDSAKHVNLLPAGGISKLDDRLAKTLLDGMGINQQEQQLVAGAVAENKQQYEKLRLDAIGKAEADRTQAFTAADTKSDVTEFQAQKSAQNLNSKMSSDERLQRFEVTATPARKGRPASKFILGNEPDTIEAVKHVAAKRALVTATQGKNRLSNAKRKLYEERMGSTLQADLASDDPDRIKFATKVLKEELSVKIDQSVVDGHINDILASFKSGNGYKKFKHKMSSQKEAVQEKRVEAERQVKRKKNIADKLRKTEQDSGTARRSTDTPLGLL